jgi:hypothetical protein
MTGSPYKFISPSIFVENCMTGIVELVSSSSQNAKNMVYGIYLKTLIHKHAITNKRR